MNLKEFLESLDSQEINEKTKYWIDTIDKDNSLRNMLGVGEDETILDVPDEKIIQIIKKHGLKAERKLVAYANMVGTHKDEKHQKEKERILSIVRKYSKKED